MHLIPAPPRRFYSLATTEASANVNKILFPQQPRPELKEKKTAGPNGGRMDAHMADIVESEGNAPEMALEKAKELEVRPEVHKALELDNEGAVEA